MLCDTLYDKYTMELLVDDDNDEGEYCIICQNENSMPKKRLKNCSCNALVHVQCIFRWLNRKRNCPKCREDVVTSFEDWNRDFYEDSARDDLDEDVPWNDQEDEQDNRMMFEDSLSRSVSDVARHSNHPFQIAIFSEHILNYIEENLLEVSQLFDQRLGDSDDEQSHGLSFNDPVDGNQPAQGPFQ